MEVAARELIPALLGEAPRRHALHRVRQSRGRRRGRALGRADARRHASRCTRATACSGCSASSRCCRVLAARAGVDLVHSLASTAPLWGRFRRVVTVHDLIYARFPEAHAGIREHGMRVLVPLAVRRSHRVIADSAEHARGPRRAARRAPPSASTSCRSASARCAAWRRCGERELRERFALGDARRAAQPVRQAPAQEPRRADRRARADPARERPLLVLPGYPTWHERELRARAAAARARARTCASSAGPRAARARGPVGRRRRVRVPLAVRGLRPARARGDGARRARRLLERLLAARGRGRRGAAASTRATSARSRRRSRALLGDRAAARAAVARGPRARARVHVGAHRAPHARRATSARCPPRSSRAPSRSEDSSDSRSRVLREPRRGALAQRQARARAPRTIASAIACGSACGATMPLTPSSISSVAALSSPATTTLGVACAAASTTTMP